MNSMVISLLNDEMRSMNLMDGKVKEKREDNNPIEKVYLARKGKQINMERDVICCCCEKLGHVLKFFIS